MKRVYRIIEKATNAEGIILTLKTNDKEASKERLKFI